MGRWAVPLVLMVLAAGHAAPAAAGGAWTAYTGRFAQNPWEDFFLNPGNIEYKRAWLLVGARSWELARPHPRLTLEGELQVGRFVGDQDHWEVNGALGARYRLTGPAVGVRASVAFGLGPSWASRDPVLERRLNGENETAAWLVYWYLEADVAPRSWGPWSAVVRLHHRSGAFGLVAEEGGSNVPSLGLRRRF